MTEVTPENLKSKSITSVMSLFFQSGYAAVLGLVANLVLTILLSPAVFGIYFTVLSVIAILNYFSDIGLAASLIQKKEITDEDVSTTFTVQQMLILSLVTIGYLATPWVMQFYDFPPEGMYLYWALLLGFFISSLKTIPSVYLERKVQFQKIVLVQIVENTVFYTSVIICALSGLGLNSFTISVILRSVIGLVVMYSISFWRPRVGISRSSLRQLLSYGVPFQASSFLALFKDDLITLYLGRVLGFEALGYIGWAKKWAEAPIRIIMDNITRVLFPVISRIQHEPAKIKKIIETIVHYQTLILAPVLLGFMLVAEPLIHIIPRYAKWQPAVPLLYLFIIAAFFSTYSTPFINLFNALGKVKVSFTFMLAWTATTWVLTPVLTGLYGFYGFPITQLILAGSAGIVVWKAHSIISFNLRPQVAPAMLSAGIMGVVVGTIRYYGGESLYSIIIMAGSGAAVYWVSLHYVFNVQVVVELRKLLKK